MTAPWDWSFPWDVVAAIGVGALFGIAIPIVIALFGGYP